ncbi:ribosome biogenesis GTP-binding protein YsxC [Colletotrichum karsti]|uniref:Ribosome biogenesis GTP-binding protein YsxC n=1 Tax=Colletotrichum karsti TaxID=1095194 RepID=A0A9P6I3M5_9PEZI|nr:ribosome biogenesis GTP-binding protein YsxC [Colletotrichum karsti]KAF9876327.1 ribosome biogenesis GTP-binding protein YsxC [Colletotrichum karsti]
MLWQMSPERREEALAREAERTGRPRGGPGGGGRLLNDFKNVRYDEERDNPRFERRTEKKEEENRDRTRETGRQTSRHDGGRSSWRSPQGGFGRGAQRSSSAPVAPKTFRPERVQGRKPPAYSGEAPNSARSAGQAGSGRGSRRSSSAPMNPEAFRSEMLSGMSIQPDRGVSERPSASQQRHEPKVQVAKRKDVDDLIPELSSEHANKVNTALKIYRARSLYFTRPEQLNSPPARSKGYPQPAARDDGGTIFASPARSLAYEHARVFFTRPKAHFLYSAANFKQHPINTTTPEVCVIGASNCGKSSFVNGLTGLSGRGMAMEGHEAGKTVTMNAYGIGSLARVPRREVASPAAAGEKGSVHGAILVDTPGYGYASRKEWGREIVEYLKKRTMLRGVVLLLSAEKRVSAQDEAVMRLVAEAGRPAMVVFTKMDKTLARGRRSEKGGIEMRLREVERAFARTGWEGWGPRIHLTAAKMERPKELASETGHAMAAAIPGMAGVRIEILEMIGLREFVAPLDRATMRDLGVEEPDVEELEVEGEQTTVGETGAEAGEEKEMSGEKREKPGKAMESDPTAWKGEILSYEELQKKFGDWSS